MHRCILYAQDMTTESAMFRTMGKRIDALLTARDMTQTDLIEQMRRVGGEDMAVSTSFMSQVINGKKRMGRDKLALVARILDTTLDYLVSGIGEMDSTLARQAAGAPMEPVYFSPEADEVA